MMDDIARYNKERWEALARGNIAYSRPMLDLTLETARAFLDPYGIMGEMTGQRVLCLGSGGGQQSAAFALLGAQVTVFDLSEMQLERDRQALAHYGLSARMEQGDMRDLARFGDGAFDMVYHAFSINFIPDTEPVFDEVARVLRAGGLYRLQWHNPFSVNVEDSSWNGRGYLVIRPYRDGELQFPDTAWDVEDTDGTRRKIEGPREFNHTLGTVINGLIQRGFQLKGLWESQDGQDDAEPGTWEHYLAFIPWLLTLWAQR